MCIYQTLETRAKFSLNGIQLGVSALKEDMIIAKPYTY